MVKKIGILALQGNYIQHKTMLDKLGTDNIYVRYPNDLDKCCALIIPGGESTTISKQIDSNDLRTPLKEYSKTHSVLGTCAGMILLSSTKRSLNMSPLGIMDFTVTRNAWGRQINSFEDDLVLEFDDKKKFHAFFIRAPKISQISKQIQILAVYNNEPVLITDGRHFSCAFHPEIGKDNRIHNHFINHING